MTTVWLLPSYLVFLFFGLYAWALGGALFSGMRGMGGVFQLPWLGYAVLIALLQVTHLFFPIDRSFSAGFLIITSVIVAVIHLSRARHHGRALRRVLKMWPRLLPLGLISFLIFVPVFNACTKPACHYDLGLYYLQEIRWMETFPIVPGLGNLIWNLGFNQVAFLVTSFLDSLLPQRIGLWLVGGLLPWLGLTLSTYALIRLFFKRRGRRSWLEIAYAISLPAWLYTLLGNNISSGSPDVTSSCLMIQLFLTFAAFIMTVDKAERTQLFGALLLLGAICLCVKLNTLGMVAGVWGVAMIFLILEKDISWLRSTRALGGAAAAVFLIGCWVYRGVIISGYPLFPSRAIAVSVAWKMKESDADQCREDTVYWARIPYGDRKVALEGFSWLRPWFKRVVAMDIQFDWPIGIGLVGAAALSLMAWMEIRLRKGFYFMILLCVPLAVETAFWLLTAPEPRYFGSAGWLFAITPILGLIAAQGSLVLLAAIANLYLCAVPMAGLFWETKWIWAAPDPRFPDIPQASLAEFQNSFGLRYYAPSEGNQSFDSALPASNRSLPDIGLLDPAAGIAGGFRPSSEEAHR